MASSGNSRSENRIAASKPNSSMGPSVTSAASAGLLAQLHELVPRAQRLVVAVVAPGLAHEPYRRPAAVLRAARSACAAAVRLTHGRSRSAGSRHRGCCGSRAGRPDRASTSLRSRTMKLSTVREVGNSSADQARSRISSRLTALPTRSASSRSTAHSLCVEVSVLTVDRGREALEVHQRAADAAPGRASRRAPAPGPARA